MSTVQGLYQRFRHLIHELLKFGVIGGVGFVVTLGGADLLRYEAGLGKYTSVGIATVVATVITFAGNRYWTFRERQGNGTTRESVLFFALNGVGLLIQWACVAVIQDGAGLDGKLWYNLANFTGIVIGTIFRFWSYRRYVWRAPLEEVLEGREEVLEPAPPGT